MELAKRKNVYPKSQRFNRTLFRGCEDRVHIEDLDESPSPPATLRGGRVRGGAGTTVPKTSDELHKKGKIWGSGIER